MGYSKKRVKLFIMKSSKKNIYWHLYEMLADRKRLWHIYIFAAIFSSLITQIAVFTNQILIDHILPSFSINTLFLFAIGLGIYQLFNVFTSAYKRFIEVHLSNIIDQFFLNKFNLKINKFSLSFIQSFKKGDLIERVSDVLKLKIFFTKFFTNILIDVFVSIYSIFILIFLDFKLTIMIIVVMVVFYFWFKFITPYLQENEKLKYQNKADFLSRMVENIEGNQVIKCFGIEENYTKKINEKASLFLKFQLKNGYISLVNDIIVALIIVTLSIIIIVILTKHSITSQAISVGQIITFIALSNKVFMSLRNILNQNLKLQEHTVILKRFLDFEEKKMNPYKSKGIKDFKIQTLLLHDLCYGYESSKNILTDISMTINKGDKIIIEGDNGSGKSTISKILTGLYKTTSGEILINNIDNSFYDQYALRGKILLSSNEDILFNDTLEENICLGRKISNQKLISLAKDLGLYDFVKSKKEKFDFLINENGKNLSTGQRKKVLLMRAFLSKAEILIFDEVLSGIDETSRTIIEKFINRESRTIIIISHEPISHILFNKNFKINNGKLHTLQNKLNKVY